MQHLSLVAFLTGQAPPQALWREIESEVDAYAAAGVSGNTGHVIITDGPAAKVAGKHIALLLDALERDELPLKSGAYIADALIFSDHFHWDDDGVAEVLFSLSDESRRLTLADVVTLRQRLSGGVR